MTLPTDQQTPTPNTFGYAFEKLLKLLNPSDFHLQDTLDHLAHMRATILDVGDLLNAQAIPFAHFLSPRCLGLVAYLVAQYEYLHCQSPTDCLFKDQPVDSPHFTRKDLYTLITEVLSMGVDVNANPHGTFAHLLAVYARDHALLTFLMDQGALVDLSDPDGHTCLERAAKDGQLEMARTLLQAGADVNRQTHKGWRSAESPIFSAFLSQSIPMLELLHSHGANLNLPSLENGQPPLTHLALLRTLGNNAVQAASNALKKIDMMRWLLEHGANVNALDPKGLSALHYMAHVGLMPPLKCLVEHGAALNIPSPEGHTELHFAAMNRYGQTKAFFELLIPAGSRFDLANDQGCTPMDIAKRYQSQEVMDDLAIYETILKEKAIFEHILTPKEIPQPASHHSTATTLPSTSSSPTQKRSL